MERPSDRAGALDRVLLAATGLIAVAALLLIVFHVPTDRTQGIVQRIFYFHLPMAWVAYLAFLVVLVSSVVYLWTRNLKWDALARSSVEIGIVFTTLVLVTGSLWAKPIWNTWWTWDARLTSTLVLWFIYVAYLMLRAYTPDLERGARFGAVVGIVGFIDIPVIHFSVQWWRTLHPDPVVARANPQLPGEMMVALLVSLLAATLLYATLLRHRVRLEQLADANRALAEHAEQDALRARQPHEIGAVGPHHA